MDDNPAARGGQAACPICGKPRAEKHRPFCSPRCADIDLHRWLGERYRVAANDTGDDGAEDGVDSAAEGEKEQGETGGA
jgi:uncharacterized protein